MNTERVGLLVVGLLVFAAGTPSLAAEITQTTGSGSWCSPAQNGNGNTVICNGVDPRALDRLNELLDRKDLDLKQKTAEANDWARRYNELNAQLEETKKQLTAKGEDATLVETAQDLLHQGKLEEARAIFDRLLQSDEANVDRAAQDHFGRASVFALQFRLDEALPDYAKAYQYRPDDQRFAEAYAYALQQQRDYPKAELVLQELLRHRRELAAQNPAAYRPDLAATLNNLGDLYDATHRFADAEAALPGGRRHSSATSRRRTRPPTGRLLATTLNNLGALYYDTHRFADAEAALKEAAGIRRELAAQNPAAYRPDLAATLNNLGALYRGHAASPTPRPPSRRPPASSANWRRRTRPPTGPTSHRRSTTWAFSTRDTHRFADAEAAYQEAVGIRRELATQNPAAYRPDLAADAQQPGRSLPGHAPLRRRRGRLEGGQPASDRELARRTRPPTGPTWHGCSTTWELSTRTRTASPTPRPPSRRPSASSASWLRRTRPPTGPIWQRRSTTWACCTATCTASPTPRPPSKRPPASGASWRRRTRPPTGPFG